MCGSLDIDDIKSIVREAVRARSEVQALRGERSRADAFDVLSELLNVERDGDMRDWMPEGWSPQYLCDSDSDS